MVSKDQSTRPSRVDTKEELVETIRQMQATIEDLNDQLSQRDAMTAADEKGWIVSTPNKNYSGRTAGILFEDGHTFIPEKRPDAKRILSVLKNDFGYSVTPTEGGKPVDETVNTDSRTLAEKLTQPQVIGA